MSLHLTKIGNEKNPPIIFLHGLFGQGDDFLYFANLLSDKYYSILIDLPGHGQSDVMEENSFINLCQKVLDSLPPTNLKTTLVGYSLGGRIALYLTCHFPQIFNQAIIISANPGIESEREERLQNDLSLLKNISSHENFFIDWYSNPLFGNLLKHQNFPHLLKKKKGVNLQNIQKCLGSFSVGVQPSLWENLKKNSLPIFYFYGEKDDKYKKIAQRLSQYPSVELIEFENAGHYLHFEYPTLFCGYLDSLLKKKIPTNNWYFFSNNIR